MRYSETKRLLREKKFTLLHAVVDAPVQEHANIIREYKLECKKLEAKLPQKAKSPLSQENLL